MGVIHMWVQIPKIIGLNKENKTSTKQEIYKCSFMIKKKNSCQMHSIDAYYCWTQSLLVCFFDTLMYLEVQYKKRWWHTANKTSFHLSHWKDFFSFEETSQTTDNTSGPSKPHHTNEHTSKKIQNHYRDGFVNVSKELLTETGIPFLSYGSNYTVTLQLLHMDYITIIEKVWHRLNKQDADELRLESRVLKGFFPLTHLSVR